MEELSGGLLCNSSTAGGSGSFLVGAGLGLGLVASVCKEGVVIGLFVSATGDSEVTLSAFALDVDIELLVDALRDVVFDGSATITGSDSVRSRTSLAELVDFLDE
jgi:hypothetical protein